MHFSMMIQEAYLMRLTLVFKLMQTRLPSWPIKLTLLIRKPVWGLSPFLRQGQACLRLFAFGRRWKYDIFENSVIWWNKINFQYNSCTLMNHTQNVQSFIVQKFIMSYDSVLAKRNWPAERTLAKNLAAGFRFSRTVSAPDIVSLSIFCMLIDSLKTEHEFSPPCVIKSSFNPFHHGCPGRLFLRILHCPCSGLFLVWFG